jgi:hypothetical protein
VTATSEDIAELRREAAAKGAVTAHLSEHELGELISRTHGDIDLAAAALSLSPRPDWLTALVGPARDA